MPLASDLIRARRSTGEAAYRVPWSVDRTYETHPLIVHGGREPADFVRIFRSDGKTQRWGRLEAGDSAELCLCDADLDEVVVTVAWFRSTTGDEYCWRFTL